MHYRLTIVVRLTVQQLQVAVLRTVNKEQLICAQTEHATKVSSCDQINMPLSLKRSRSIVMIVSGPQILEHFKGGVFKKLWTSVLRVGIKVMDLSFIYGLPSKLSS